MPELQYVIFDNALEGAGLNGWSADGFAAALRSPLAAIGVTVERKGGRRTTVGFGELVGADQLSITAYKDKYDLVYRVVRRVLGAKRRSEKRKVSAGPPPPPETRSSEAAIEEGPDTAASSKRGSS